MVVLGSTGMLGHQVVKQLRSTNVEIFGVEGNSRGGIDLSSSKNLLKVLSDFRLGAGDFIVNSTGLVKSVTERAGHKTSEQSIRINSLLPHVLGSYARENNLVVLQPATDCVYSGMLGNYIESSNHDATDIYGKTKSLGEVNSEVSLIIRCSFIGPELETSRMLFEWFRNLPPNQVVTGFVNHIWNGVSSVLLAKVFAGLITSNSKIRGTFHLVPRDSISKYELLRELKFQLPREDIVVTPAFGCQTINRSLATEHPNVNQALWELAGFKSPPSTIEAVQTLW